MMIKANTIFLTLLLSGCSSMPYFSNEKNPAEDEIKRMKLQTFNVLKSNIQSANQPLDLTTFKDMKFKIENRNGEPYVAMHYSDFSRLVQMMQIVSNKIEVQRASIDTVLELYEKEIVGTEAEKEAE